MTEHAQLSLALTQDSAGGTSLPTVIAGVFELVQLIDATSITRVQLGVGEVHVEIEAAHPVAVGLPPAAPQPTDATPSVPDSARASAPSPAVTVRAMLVGVFYRSPQPGAEPFVEIGARVEAGQQLAIVEAMKMMTPVVADRSGIVTEIMADNGEVVEFDQPLFTLDLH